MSKACRFPHCFLRSAHEVSSRGSRVLRGGSWHNNATNVRVANRNNNTPTNTNNNNGFRCAKTLVEKHFRIARVGMPPM
ncbi:SUMF1/EgtB/PvdO family nonheme iron enzyme [Candidatus Poribacteria bacterium]|nr:SUMF1/EgtB/PvdO family nonheme iron enzyme [Candidatus Poribacteria bacterium]MYH83197.1 SUMF1/EgtB/PvdO family nonheme iron enzyme [Candidatus Poribacteria bacterium]MYK95003.1 SUMF1/EgtB/PvdO family nonheme iron enzyme [Candidatus Poribacteria bacterium]